MHAAPSVSYPVGRSAFALGACVLLAACGLLAAAAWTWQSGFGWRQALAFACLLATAASGLHAWRRSPRGVLRWDGTSWWWEEGGAVTQGRPETALDLQARMLLHWRADAGRAAWLWAERASAPSDWDALRRAVYSRASTPVPAASKPDAAEQ